MELLLTPRSTSALLRTSSPFPRDDDIGTKFRHLRKDEDLKQRTHRLRPVFARSWYAGGLIQTARQTRTMPAASGSAATPRMVICF